MLNKKQLAAITILVKDRQKHSNEVQRILTDSGHLIMARLGVNLQRACVENCAGLIVIAVEGTKKEINDLTKKLNKLYGIVAKANIMTD
ncbi:hypothetical protein KJ586_00250 [Patescibacteria group bacterium]|nr:hypothetical protein [Patescibacteria group bacterium]MBU4347215.1 hypothetical protein [Patescibacteria group bacterium]MBU4454933.1 hypothetical protein [Patescibacteria group bacterium]